MQEVFTLNFGIDFQFENTLKHHIFVYLKLAGEVPPNFFFPLKKLELKSVHNSKIIMFKSLNEVFKHMLHLTIRIAAHNGLFTVRD